MFLVDCPLVIVEFVPFGDLLGYLRKIRGVQDSCYFDPDHLPAKELSTQELMKFSVESAQGMQYLSRKKVCGVTYLITMKFHRDGFSNNYTTCWF